jgi:glucosamine-6-phosphate deaminase
MRLHVFPDQSELAAAAARDVAGLIRDAVAARGVARVVVAAGASQSGFLAAVGGEAGVAWNRVELFHLDEYVGVGPRHPASLRRYLRERLVEPAGITRVHLLDGEREPARVCAEVGRAIGEAPVDVAVVGIGDNARLAFNDPPADFGTTRPFLVVTLDPAVRQQLVNEGWFPSLVDVPARAITMSVRQILRSRTILGIAPGVRKADAVRATVVAPITPVTPASILRTHADTSLYLDNGSASLLPPDHPSAVRRG